MTALLSLYETGIMRRALLEAILVGALCGAVGVHVVLRKLPFFTITVAHAAFPGIVLAAIIGIGEMVGGFAFVALVVVAVHATTGEDRLDTSTAAGVALAGSFGVGIVLQSSQPGFTKDLAAILVGSILTVSVADIVVTAVAGAVVLALLAGAHKELVLRAFDPTGAQAMGYPPLLDLGLLAAVGATIVVAVPAVGTILVVALLSIPALSARLVTRRVGPAMVAGALYGAAAGVAGLTVSARWDVAAGASISLASAALFLATWLAVESAGWVGRRRAAPKTSNVGAWS